MAIRAAVYFGTRGYMQWVPAPAINVDASKVGWTSQTNYLNGGAYVRNSTNSHKEYQFSWNLDSRDNIRLIQDYADGLYGGGPIYYLDPFTTNYNMLPSAWANPYMGAYDGLVLDGKSTILRPTLTSTTTNTLGYPSQSAIYTVGAETKPVVWLPVPPGYTIWVGSHGVNGTGGTVIAAPTTGPTSIGTPVTLTTLAVTSTTRVNQSFDGNTYNGMLLYLGGTGTITLSGIIVQVLPTGVTPLTGGFISGQGHSGLQFAGQPVLTQYSAGLDMVGMTAKLVETTQWL